MPPAAQRYAAPVSNGPLLVFGPRSVDYDFGPEHPLTPRRFGPGVDLLRALGAESGLAPEPAPDEDLLLLHSARYLAAVKRLSADPDGPAEAGIGRGGDDPSFAGMHEAAAAVAGGSMRAMEAILRGDVEHAFHPGGGLHHAMRDRASGFCIYDDPALAIALARRAGLRVLYLDFDVHHGDGVQTLFLDDPGVLTLSFHESGQYLFPGTGFVHELGWGAAAGTSVNMPFQPPSGETVWLRAVRDLVPPLAAAFGPDVVVSQHGADSHAWDPLAHMLVTTTAMGAAARLTDEVAHRHAQGRWLATGGGGYDAYRVVPRSWSHVWLAGAHREPPGATPAAWRERWAAEAARFGQAPMPTAFDDPPNAGMAVAGDQERAEGHSADTLRLVRSVVLPRLLRLALERRWWKPDVAVERATAAATETPAGIAPTIVSDLQPAALERLNLAPRVLPPVDPAAGRALLVRATRDGARVIAALAGDRIVGAAVLATTPPQPDGLAGGWEVAALGVAPSLRQRGLATALIRAAVDAAGSDTLIAATGVAERDVVEPLPVETRTAVARRLLETAGFRVRPASGAVGQADSAALTATHG
jgi:acetoin utilization protein AcuC